MAIAAYKIGNYATDTLTGKVIKIMTKATFGAIAANGAYPFQINGANYQVTAGKTFYPTGVFIEHDGNGMTAGCVPILRYADDAVLTTNPVSLDFGLLISSAAQASLATVCYPIGGINVPAAKYIGIFNTTATASGGLYMVTLVGYEA